MSERKCPECERPFTGRRDKVYCSRQCMCQAKDRRWRAANLEHVAEYQRAYRAAARRP